MALNLKELLLDRARRVSHVDRYAGMPRIRKENVAEHMYYTTQYCYFIARHLEFDHQVEVNYGKLLSRAVVHDLDESVTGDITRAVKYRDPIMKKQWDSMSKEVITDLQSSIGVPFIHEWANAKDESIEGQILKVADLISVTAYAVEELRTGNTYFIDILNENTRWFDKLLNEGNLIPPLFTIIEEVRNLAEECING